MSGVSSVYGSHRRPINKLAARGVARPWGDHDSDKSGRHWKAKSQLRRKKKKKHSVVEVSVLPSDVRMKGASEQNDGIVAAIQRKVGLSYCPRCGMPVLNVASHLKNVHGVITVL